MKLSDLDLDLRLPKPPMVLVAVLVIGAFVPMGVASAIWYKRNAFDPHPRIHIFQDMDNQAKAKAQSSSAVFADGRSMQAYAPGTVAWGRSVHTPDPAMLKDDDLAYRGFEVDPETGEEVLVPGANEGDAETFKYLAGYPDIVTVDKAFIRRGQAQYRVHCFHCHGADGRGMGPVRRAMDELALRPETGTVALAVADLTAVNPEGTDNAGQQKFGEALYPNGQLYNTITQGQGTMGPVGLQMTVEDRWAVVAYVRALQKAQPDASAPAEQPAAE